MSLSQQIALQWAKRVGAVAGASAALALPNLKFYGPQAAIQDDDLITAFSEIRRSNITAPFFNADTALRNINREIHRRGL